jgi:hypothetical protein
MQREIKREKNLTEEFITIAAQISDYESKIRILRSRLEFLQKEQEHSNLHNLKMLMDENLDD